MQERIIKTDKNKGLGLLQKLFLILVFLAGFAIRVYDLQDPPLDFHAVRQLRSALISRSVYYQLDKTLDPDLRQKALVTASLEEYEPPIFEQIVGLTYFLIGSEKLWVSRIYLALFWSIGGWFLYLLLRRTASFYAALCSLAVYFSLPFSVIASRSFQPEPWMVMWILIAAYSILRWSETRSWKWAVIAGLTGGMAVLVKAVAILFVAGMVAFTSFLSIGIKKFFRSAQFWVLTLLTLAPASIYLLSLQQGRSSSFLSFWIGSLSWLILEPEFYADWLAMIKTLSGLSLLAAAVIGAFLSQKDLRPILLGGWFGYVLYGLIFPYQYTTHEYYHLPLVALLALSLGPVFESILQKLSGQIWVWKAGVAGVILFSSFYSLYVSRSILYADNYEFEPYSWELVGESIPQESNFIALTSDYGMRLRYYGWRIGASWPSGADLNLKALGSSEEYNFQAYFDELTQGKDYFLVTALSEFDSQQDLKDFLYEHFPVYKEGNGFILFNLQNDD